MKRVLCAMILIGFVQINAVAKSWNKIVANVGNYAITQFDINKMNEFMQMSGELKKGSEKKAFQQLLINYTLLSIADNDARMKVSDKEINEFIATLTNITNQEDPSAQYRLNLYTEFPDEYRLAIKKEQVLRALTYFNEEIKSSINVKMEESKISNYYKKNKKKFMDYPYLDFVVLGIERKNDIGLFELEALEKSLTEIAGLLKSTDDGAGIVQQYRSSVKFEPYSGRSGKKQIMELLTNGYPEEVLNICMMNQVSVSADKVVKMRKGAIFGPQMVPIRKEKKNVYLIIKIIEKTKANPMEYAKVRDFIERKLRMDNLEAAIKSYIVKTILDKKVLVRVVDNKYQGVLNAFLRR